MIENVEIRPEKAKELVERWLRNDKTLTLPERVLVLEKMLKHLLVKDKEKKTKE